MQAWNQVKVIKEGDPNEGRAGVVRRVSGDRAQVTVVLDGDDAEHAYTPADLQILV